MDEPTPPAVAPQKSPGLVKLEKALPRMFAALSLLSFVGMTIAVYVDRQSDQTLQQRGIRVEAKIVELDEQLRRRRRRVTTVEFASVEYTINGTTHKARLEVGNISEDKTTLALIVLPEAPNKPVLASSVQAKAPFDYGRFFMFAIPFSALFGLILTIFAFATIAKYLGAPITRPATGDVPASSQVPALRPVNGPATWSMVLGLLGVCVPLIGVIAVGLGHWGLRRAAQLGIGRKAAITGLVLGYMQTCMWGYFFISQLM